MREMPPPTGTDRRYGYVRVLAKEAQNCNVQYKTQHWQFCCRWIAQIALAEVPLPSRHAVRQLPTVGDECVRLLERAEKAKQLVVAPPKRGMFCSAAAAMLVALLEHEEAATREGKPPPSLCPKGTLIERAAKLCVEQSFKPLEAHTEAEASGAASGCPRCPSFYQMQHLKHQACTCMLLRTLCE